MFRVIREFRPTWVIAENVGGLLTIEQGMVFEQVCVDLETEGYEVQTFIIPACAVNAPHRRDRVWFIAHADQNKCNRTERRCVNEEKRKEGKVGEKDNPAGEFAGTDSKLYADRKSDGYVTNPNNRGQKIQEQQAAGDQQCDRRFAADAVCPNSRGKNNDGLQNKRRRFCSNRGAGIQSKDREACADNIKQGDGIIADAGSAVCDGRGKITTTGDKDRVLSSKQSRKQTRCSASRCDDATVGKEQVDRDPDLIGLQGGGEERYCSEQIGLYGGKDYGWDEDWVKVASAFCSVDDGLSDKLVRLSDGRKISYGKWRTEALMAVGNAIVPAVAIEIMKAIKAAEESKWVGGDDGQA